MNLLNFMAMISRFADLNDVDTKVYDLSTDEGLEGYNKQLDELESTDLDILKLFGVNGKKWIDGMRDLGKKIHDENNKKEDKKQISINTEDIVKNNVKMQRQEVDHSEDKKEDKFKKPSEDLSINQKLQLHKIVQEYVDTMINPYNDGVLTNKQINDAYAGLYEFAAWIMNR